MKISKSKQELARIISENGGWRDGEFAAQDGDGGIGGYEVKPEWDSLAKYWWREASGQWFFANKIKNHHQTVLSRAEYFHLYPAPDADGWIEWKGGAANPVEFGVLVDVKLANGEGLNRVSANSCAEWRHCWGDANIIAYRLHNPEQDKPRFCESVMGSIPGPIAKPTIEQLAADYRNAKDYADRKQQEADDAKAVADAALGKLERAGEALGLVIGITKPEPELVITDWRDLREGDVIKLTAGERYNETECTICTIPGVVGLRAKSSSDDEGEWWNLDGPTPSDWKFIRRP